MFHTGPPTDEENRQFPMYSKPYDRKYTDANNFLPIPGHGDDMSRRGQAGRSGSQDSPQNTVQPPSRDQHIGHGGGNQMIPKPSTNLTLDVEDLDIPWSDLVLKDRIGAGIYHNLSYPRNKKKPRALDF